MYSKTLIGLFFLSLSWTPYRIERGHHYTQHECISLIENNVLRFDAIFGKTCLYNPDLTDGEGDLNKLYGFTDCGSLVHENSARFAWRHNGNGDIEIFAYLYVDGVRNFFKMGETRPRVRDSYEIHADHNVYYFRFNNTDTTLTRTKECNLVKSRVKNFPYFGGDYPAPNTMVIWIREYKQL